MARLRGIKQPHPLGSIASRSGVQQLTAASGGTISSGGVKISALPAASAANDIDQLEANQAGTTRRITLEQVAAHVMAQIAGTPPTLSPLDFGATGDGIANDTAALQATINAAAANDAAVDMSGSFTYRVTQIVVPDGVVMVGSNSVIAITDTLTDPAAIAIVIGSNVTIETLNVTSPGPGAGATDIISIGSGTRIGLLSIAATVQRTGGGIETKGQDVRIDYLKSVNFDRPFDAYNGLQPAPTTGLHIGFADITSYVRGLRFIHTYGFTLGGYHLRGRSPNASVSPGHNGILLGGCSNWTFGAGTIENSGEHAIRIGGADDGGATDNATIGHLTAIRPGGCAFKINPDTLGQLATRITIAGVTGIDCGETPAGPTGNNLECVRISNARHIVFEGPIVAAKKDFGNACSHVLMLGNVQYFSAPLVYAEDTFAGCLVFLTQNGDANPNNVENVYIDSVVGTAGLDAIRSDITGFNVGNIFINDILLLGQPVGRGVANFSTPLAVSGPIHLSGRLLGSDTPVFTLPNDPLVTKDFSWSGTRVSGHRTTTGTFKSPQEWITAPFGNESTVTYQGGPYINSSTLSTAGSGNFGAGIFGSRLGTGRRGWGIWPVQTGSAGTETGVIVGVGHSGSTTAENLTRGLMINHRGVLTSPVFGDLVTAPGAGFAKLVWTTGTTAGTAKLVAYAGTSTTPVTIVDNVGSGV